MRTAVERELAVRGYRKTSGEPDFLVATFAAGRERVDVRTVNEYWRYRGYRGRWVSVTRVDVDHYTRGTVIIDIVDPARRELIWRGWAEDAVRDPTPEKIERKINEAVEKLLARFPPPR